MSAKYPSLRIEGGLLAAEIIDDIAEGKAAGQKPRDFGFTDQTHLIDQISAAWSDARGFWQSFWRRAETPQEGESGVSFTRAQWAIPLFNVLGYDLALQDRAAEVDGLTFAISHRADAAAGSPPVHVVGAWQSLDRRAESGRPRLAPHSLVQEYLNRTEYLWGVVTNGRTLRLLRDSQLIRRQAYIEFNLETMFNGEHFADFALFFRLLHRSRLPHPDAKPDACLLEQWYQQTIEQGGRVREHLREGVEGAIPALANAILRHPRNADVRQAVADRELKAQALYEELLRLVYRLLFLMVTEERNLLTSNAVYRERYSISRLRRLCENRYGRNQHVDLWAGLQSTFRLFAAEEFGRVLEAPPLNGDLFDLTKTPHLNSATVANADFLNALWSLAMYREDRRSAPRRINYSALDVEELGSVYESLLDLQPVFAQEEGRPVFSLIKGTQRKTTGSYYTHPELVDELVQSALVPVMQERLSAARTPKDKEKALLEITVCDPACGSGHFLLAAARRLARELAQIRGGEEEPSPREYRLALRDVISHCIYGVDRNPLAVELCRVALWLESHAEAKPLSFLDHRILCGNSLVGVRDLAILKNGVPDDAYKPVTGDDKDVAKEIKKQNRREGAGFQMLDFAPAQDVTDLTAARKELFELPDDTPEQIRRKKAVFEQVRAGRKYAADRLAADLWCAAFFAELTEKNRQDKVIPTTSAVLNALERRPPYGPMVGLVAEIDYRARFFHWPLEFPEVFARGGFDVIIGNPPFLGGLKINEVLGDKHRNYLATVYSPYPGRADLCAAFFRRAFELVAPSGRMGLVASNSISQGETREGGLAAIVAAGGTIVAAHRYIRWPGDATVEVNLVTCARASKSVTCILDGRPVPSISSRLDSEPEHEPFTIPANSGLAFQGSIVLGTGFLLDPNEATHLIQRDPRNAECLFPYLTGEDLNSSPKQEPSRWVIQFDERTSEEAQKYPDLWAIVTRTVLPERQTKDRLKYPRMVDEWWKHWNNRRELYLRARRLPRVMARSRISELHSIAFVPSSYVFSEQVIVFALQEDHHFCLLQSSVHEIWARRNSSTLRTDVRYTPTTCFETFTFPPASEIHAARAGRVGAHYSLHRRRMLEARSCGLTSLYNCFHDPQCVDPDIRHLRELHAHMDRIIADWYGWSDLALDHGFYLNERGLMRFSVSPASKQEILRRLVALNASQAASVRSVR